VPVIGVPWYQVAHLPDAPLICHEVGHDLEAELELTVEMERSLEAVLDGFDAGRSAAWRAWRAELFADLYGMLCTGPAFVAAMADLLAADPVQVADEARTAAIWDPLPPASLRMRTLTHTLTLQGFGQEATQLWDAWRLAFSPRTDDPFVKEAPAIIEALWSTEYEALGGTVHGAITFSQEQQRVARAVETSVLSGDPPQTTDVRCVIAAARYAFDADPAAYPLPPTEADAATRTN
jgi:hypothetical protein